MKISSKKPISDINPNLIIDAVCDYYHQPKTHLIGSSRRGHLIEPRHTAMYLLRHRVGLGLDVIGGHFGGRDHTTVLHAVRTAKRAMAVDPEFARRVFYLEKEIEHRVRVQANQTATEIELEIENLVGCA
jgi:chromosomal replication initiator protein